MDVTAAVAESARVFGLTLKEKQLEAIILFVSGRDTFVSLPTGYGKSICYAILPSVFDKIKGTISMYILIKKLYKLCIYYLQAQLEILWFILVH